MELVHPSITHNSKKRLDFYLLMTSRNTGIFLVMTVKIAVGVHMLKSDSLVLPPCLSASLDFNSEIQSEFERCERAREKELRRFL